MPQHQTHNENELLLRFAQRDETAFSSLYKEFYTTLYLYAEKLSMKNITIAQDATAEAFIELWKSNRVFETFDHLLGFLRKVVRNKCVDKYRQIKKETAVQKQLGYLFDEREEDALFSQALMEASLIKRIQIEVEKLPRHTKEVFKLSYFEGLKNAEVASRLRITDATVRRRKTEALHSLRSVFKGMDWELLGTLLVIWGYK